MNNRMHQLEIDSHVTLAHASPPPASTQTSRRALCRTGLPATNLPYWIPPSKIHLWPDRCQIVFLAGHLTYLFTRSIQRARIVTNTGSQAHNGALPANVCGSLERQEQLLHTSNSARSVPTTHTLKAHPLSGDCDWSKIKKKNSLIFLGIIRNRLCDSLRFRSALTFHMQLYGYWHFRHLRKQPDHCSAHCGVV